MLSIPVLATRQFSFMAELMAAGAGLGIASSLITFGDVAFRVIKRIKEYSEISDNIPAVLKHIHVQLPILAEKIKEIQRDNENKSISILPETALAVAVTSCGKQIGRLDILTQKLLPSESDSRKRRAMKAVQSIYYEREVGRAWAEMETYKTTLILHFTKTTDIVTELEALHLKSPVFSVPFERDLNFIARTDIMNQVNLALRNQGRFAIAGIGGIGKSQIAIEYCYKFSDMYPEAHVFWIHAATSDRFIQAYNDVARKLLIPGWNDPKADTLQIVHEWFMNEKNGRWLLILDNADNMEIFHPSGDSKTNVQKEQTPILARYLPSRSKGSILITTRDSSVGRNLANGKEPLGVFPMTPDEGKAMLLSRVPDNQPETDLEQLLVELEYLPLAITQAAAFISQNYIDLSEYLELLHANDANILDKEFYDWRRDPEATNSMIRTWRLSFDQIRRRQPYAADILSLMSVLDRQGLSKTLFCRGNEQEAELVTAFGTLQAFSLITADKGKTGFEMHRLVQMATRKWLELQGALNGWQEKALSLLTKKFPFPDYENWTVCKSLTPHVQVVLKYEFETDSSRLDCAGLLYDVAQFETTQGRYKAAEEMSRGALKECEKTFEENDLRALAALHNLAVALQNQGKYEAAEEIYRRTLKGYEKTLGENDLTTLNNIDNLAAVLQCQGKYETAEKLSWRALKESEKILGENHSDTLITVQILANTLGCQNKYEKAEEMNWRALKGYEKILGENHPNTLISAHNLAWLFHNQKKYNEATKLYQRACEGLQKILGPEHPDTVTVQNNYKKFCEDVQKSKRIEEI